MLTLLGRRRSRRPPAPRPARGAANAERRGRRRDLHVAGLGDRGGDEGDRALGDIEDAGILIAAILVDVMSMVISGVGRQMEGGAVIEGDAEREAGEVCTVSSRKMSSLSFSAIESWLRITVATPFSVATLPISSSEGVCAGEAVAGSCACGACACASRAGSVLASSITGVVMSTPAGDGIAERCCVPPTSKQPRRANASKNRYVTMKPRLGREEAWQGTGLAGKLSMTRFDGLRSPPPERSVNDAASVSRSVTSRDA